MTPNPNPPDTDTDIDTDPSPHFIPAGAGTRKTIFPGVDILVNAGQALMISLVDLDENAVVPDHRHPHEQMGLLLEGTLEFTIDGRTRVLRPGDAWRIPGGVPHSVRAVGGPARALDVFHPVREDYL